MTKLYRILVVLFVLLSAFLIYLLVQRSAERRPLLFQSDVSEDSVAAYARRADSLSVVAETLTAQFNHSGLLRRPGLSLRLNRLNEEIDGLRMAVERWREAQQGYDKNQAYHECILIYGRASGICEGLKTEADTGK